MNRLLTFMTCLLFAGVLQAQEIKNEQISLVTKKTATWCPNCGAAAWTSFLDMIEDGDGKSLPIAAHFSSSSELFSTTAAAIVDNFEFVPGQPVFYFNRERLSGSGASTVTQMNERVQAASEQTPLVGLGIEAAFENGQLTFAYAMEFLEATSGTYQVGFYPIRKTVIARQSNQGNEAEHKQILDNELLGADFGIVVADGDIEAGTTTSNPYVVNNAAGYNTDVENGNLDLAIIVWNKVGDNEYEYVNAAFTNVIQGQLSNVETLSSSVTKITAMPTQAGTTLLEVDTKTALDKAQLNIFSIDGRLLAQPYTGKLSTGKHQFSFEGKAGIYVANLLVDGKQVTKKFIVQ